MLETLLYVFVVMPLTMYTLVTVFAILGNIIIMITRRK